MTVGETPEDPAYQGIQASQSSATDPREAPSSALHEEIERLSAGLRDLERVRDAELAATMTRFFRTLAVEAARSPRLANALAKAITPRPAVRPSDSKPKRANRRRPGPLDPFAAYADRGEEGLREALAALDLEQLRDIVAEHGMDHDRLAMRWKDPRRVTDRIVERVVARAAKGSAFRR